MADVITIASRQQVTPGMRFTCSGFITKWIFGGDWNSRKHIFPEFQVWRNNGNSTYRKIGGISMELPSIMRSRIYVYVGFPPIPIQPGDILGIFAPNNSRLRLLSEKRSSPTNYYLPAGNSEIVFIDLQRSDIFLVSNHYPLVSAIIGMLLNIKYCSVLLSIIYIQQRA